MSDGLTLLERAEEAAGKVKHFENELVRRSDEGEAVTVADWNKLEDMANGVMALKAEAKAKGISAKVDGVIADMLGTGGTGTAGEPAAGGGNLPGETGIVDPKGMTLGEALMASPAIKEQLANPAMRTSLVELHGSMFNRRSFVNAGGLITTTDDTAGPAKPQPMRDPNIVDITEPPDFRIRDLCTNLPLTTGDSFEWMQLISRNNNARIVPEAATKEAVGATSSVLAGNPVVSEILAGTKPYSDFTLVKRDGKVKWIAHLMKETETTVQDIAGITALINQELIRGLDDVNDIEILLGDGTDEDTSNADPNLHTPGHLRGILAAAPNDWGIQTRSAGAGESDLDAVGLAVAQIRKWRPTAMVINSADWYSTGFALNKDGNGQYRLGGPRQPVDAEDALWRMRTVVSDLIPQGQILLGNFRTVRVYDRMRSRIQMTRSNVDDFERNLVSIRAENRLGVGIRNPNALCLLDITTN